MFVANDQLKAWKELQQAIDQAEEQVPCPSFPDLFFPNKGDGESANAAKKMCFTCPVQVQCGIYAIRFEDSGVWGGLTAVERREIRKARGMLDPVAAQSVMESFDSPVDPLFGTDLADAS
jgi:hypothetical protein